MATSTKTVSTKKPTAAKSVKVKAEVADVVEETVEEVAPVTAKVVAKKFEEHDLIPCYSVFPGSVTMIGRRTGNVYVWDMKGVTENVEYVDLIAEVRNRRSVYIYEPFIVVDDADFLAENTNLQEIYEGIYSADEIEEALQKFGSSELKKFIEGLPEGIKNTIPNIAMTMINNGELDSMNAIKTIDGIFGTALGMQASSRF